MASVQRKRSRRSEPHAESLMRIPLVRQMLVDDQVRLVGRGLDTGWANDKIIPFKVTGFNPTHSAIYYGMQSPMARWLNTVDSSARALNFGDHLIKEVLFAVHDYLHAWAYLAINEMAPHLGFGTRRIERKNLETFAFLHLITEAVAVVGLDYWYLATMDLNEVCPIGTMQGPLTIHYHETQLSEIRRFSPALTVQSPEFFRAIVEMYCSGVFVGFSKRHVALSPMLLNWMRHELLYAARQREYVRDWLAYLSPDRLAHTPDELTSPVAFDKPWQRRVVDNIGQLLWDKVKSDRLQRFHFRFEAEKVWRSKNTKANDFRFVNLNTVVTDDSLLKGSALRINDRRSFSCFAHQFVSRHAYQPGIMRSEMITHALSLGDASALAGLFKGIPTISPERGELRDMMILG